MGVVQFIHQSADATPPILNTGSTVPEFGPGSAILVIQDSANGNPLINGNIRLDGAQINISGAVPSFLDITGPVQGSGFNQTGSGTLLLNGANNFSGAVTVSGGTLKPANSAALNIASSGSLHLNGGILSGEYFNFPNVPLYVDGPYSQLQAYTPWKWGGPVVLNSTLTVSALDLNFTNAPINFSGPISGVGGLYLQNEFFGTATVQLSGSQANTFSGPIIDHCQLLEFNKPANVPAFGGPLIAGGPGGVAMGEVRWLNSGQGATPNVTVYSNCVVNLNNFSENFATVTFNGGDIETGAGQLSLFGPVTANPAGVTATMGGNLSIQSPGSQLFEVGAGGVDPDLLINASITGATALVLKTGPGILRLAGNNKFTANVEVGQGALEMGNPNGMGSPSNLVTVDAGTTLQADPGVIAANPISLSGGLVVPAGQSVVLSGNITLQNPTTMNVAGNLLIDAAISGNGGLTKAGVGTLTFGGGTDNTYVGDTLVSRGTLVLGKLGGATAIPGRLIIGNSLFGAGPSTVVQNSSFTITGSVTVNGGLWDLNGQAEGFSTGGLQGDQPLTLRNGGSVQTESGIVYIPTNGNVVVIPGIIATSTISGHIGLDPGPHFFEVGQRSAAIAGPECTVNANITETSTAAQLIKSSPGTLLLTGNNNYTGSTIVSNGTLEVDGLQPQSPVQVYAATLKGIGSVGSLEMDDPNAVLSPSGMICGNFNQGAAPAGTFQVKLSGELPGVLYSQLQATGIVSLANLNLAASLDFYSAYGDQFTIIANGGTAAPVGEFNGLPEGAIFQISGELFQITYAGGSGRDVVITHLSPASQAGIASWINGAGGDWNNGANWNTGIVPNGSDALVTVATSCVISNNATTALAGLFYNSPQCTVTGSGNFSLSGLFNWQAGAFNGSGSLMATGGLHLESPTSSSLSLAGYSLINSGPATWSAGASLTLSSGAVLSNAPAGTFDCVANETIYNGPGTNLFANDGLFQKIESVGTTTIRTPFNNSGTVKVATGTLDLPGGGVHAGTFEVSSGATLSFSSGIHNLLPLAMILGAGDFNVLGGAASLLGTVTTQGAHNFNGGIVNLGGNYDPSGNDLSIGACTVNFVGTNPITAGSLTVGGFGTLGGTNLLSVSGPMVWNSTFTITGGNSVIANGGLTIAAGGGLLGRTLLNMASGVWSNSGVGTLTLGSSALFSNAPGATFDCIGTNTFGFTTGSGTVANGGLFRTIGPPATTTVETPFNNTGTIEVQSGTLNLSGGGTNSGTIDVFANATLALGGGFTLAPGGSIIGAGELLIPASLAEVNLYGTVSLGGSYTFNGGVANLTGNYVCSNVALTIGAGTANFNSSNVVSPASLTLDGDGSLGGTNLLTVSGPMTWNGSFAITGTNNVIANGGLTIGPGNVVLIGRTLVNMASALWTNNVTGAVALGGGAMISNAAGATFDCVGTNIMATTTGGGTFANAGLFQTVGPPAVTTIQVPFSNNAVVEVQSGVLSLADGGSSISTSNSLAEIAVFSNATVDFHSGTFFLDPSAMIDGPGNLSISGGTADLAGEVDVMGNHTFSGGTANITGFYNCVSNALVISGGTANFNGSGVIAPSSLLLGDGGTLGGSNFVTVSGPMTWGGGGSSAMIGANSVTVNGGLTIGPGNVTMSGRTLINAGFALWTNNGPGSITLSGGATLVNVPGAIFDCIGNGTIGFSIGAGSVANSGLFRIRGAGAETIVEVPFTNNGTIEVDAGAFGISSAPYVQSGGSTFLNGGNIFNSAPLQIMGGALTGTGLISGSVTNAGLLNPGATFGQTTIGGSYSQIDAGALAITLAGPNSGTGFNNLVVDGAANLGGTLAVNVVGGFQPAIGTRFQILSCANRSGVFNALNVPVGISVNYSNNGVFLVVTGAIVLPPTLPSPQLSGGNLTFNFPTVTNQSYTIQQNTNLATQNWFFVTNFLGNGSVFQFVAPVSATPQSVFRVRQP